ncbi:polysaccharide deacetylase family protein [Paenibacillus sp. P26]|nr:polysaccharide deacetylase family protein [Paenibacillus sp. P26]
MITSKHLYVFAMAAVLLATCSAKPAPTVSGTTGQPAASAPAQQERKEQPSTSGGATPSAAAETAPAKPAEPVKPPEVKKLYKMNPKSYDIIPIDPSATNKKVVLLTFDDGPKELEMNQALLDILDKHKAKAIFFMNGYRIKQKPELVKLVSSRGMAVGNHAWDHDDLSKQSKDKLDHQIGDVSSLVKELTGKAPVFFRPPYGSGNQDVRAKVKEEGMLYMTWSNGSKDWEMTNKNNHPEQVISNVLEQLRSGSNILMHESPWTVKALDEC